MGANVRPKVLNTEAGAGLGYVEWNQVAAVAEAQAAAKNNLGVAPKSSDNNGKNLRKTKNNNAGLTYPTSAQYAVNSDGTVKQPTSGCTNLRANALGVGNSLATTEWAQFPVAASAASLTCTVVYTNGAVLSADTASGQANGAGKKSDGTAAKSNLNCVGPSVGFLTPSRRGLTLGFTTPSTSRPLSALLMARVGTPSTTLSPSRPRRNRSSRWARTPTPSPPTTPTTLSARTARGGRPESSRARGRTTPTSRPTSRWRPRGPTKTTPASPPRTTSSLPSAPVRTAATRPRPATPRPAPAPATPRSRTSSRARRSSRSSPGRCRSRRWPTLPRTRAATPWSCRRRTPAPCPRRPSRATSPTRSRSRPGRWPSATSPWRRTSTTTSSPTASATSTSAWRAT